MVRPRSRTVTIAAGAALSGAVALDGATVVGLAMPAAWDAAAVTFLVSDDGGATFGKLYDRYGAEYTVQAAAGGRYAVPPADLCGWDVLKVQSGTGAGTNQAAERAIRVVCRPV